MFGCSPDDIAVIKGTGMHGITGSGIVEYKCPFQRRFDRNPTMQHNAEISARISKWRQVTGNRLAFFPFLVDF